MRINIILKSTIMVLFSIATLTCVQAQTGPERAKTAVKKREQVDVKNVVMRILNEAQQIKGASSIYTAVTGEELTDLDKLVPDYLVKLPDSWQFTGTEFQWSGKVLAGKKFCEEFHKIAAQQHADTYCQCSSVKNQVLIKLDKS